MKSLTLIYGLRLIPEEGLKSTRSGEAILKDGSVKRVTLHMIEGSPEQIKHQLLQSVDAFFDILPGEDEREGIQPSSDDFSEL